MSSPTLAPRSALHGASLPATTEIKIELIEGLTVAHVSARKGRTPALVSSIREHLKLELPSTPRAIEADGVTILWAGPDQWLVTAPATNARDLERELAQSLADLAAVSDQSDSRTIFRVSGSAAAAVLATGIGIDLHPKAFDEGGVAITSAAHIGVILWRSTRGPSGGNAYYLACSRSYAHSLADWLIGACTSAGVH